MYDFVWHSMQQPERPEREQEVLVQHENGDFYLAFWRDDAGCFDAGAFCGFVTEIIAWAAIPAYIGVDNA